MFRTTDGPTDLWSLALTRRRLLGAAAAWAVGVSCSGDSQPDVGSGSDSDSGSGRDSGSDSDSDSDGGSTSRDVDEGSGSELETTTSPTSETTGPEEIEGTPTSPETSEATTTSPETSEATTTTVESSPPTTEERPPPPEIGISFPSQGAVFCGVPLSGDPSFAACDIDGPELVYEGTVSAGARVFVGPYEADVVGTNWSIQLTLSTGPQTTVVVARDAFGQEGVASVSVTYYEFEPSDF